MRALLPPPVQAILLHHEAAGTTDSDEYTAAVRVFNNRHVCRIPWPAELEASFNAMAADPTVYHTMNGPSEFHCIGTIKDWSIIDRLPRIGEPTRRDRLLLVSAFAMALLTLLGAVGESLGMDRQRKSNTSKTRTHSLFRQGCMLYELIPNMPEHRLEPLMAAFEKAVSQAGQFNGIFT